MRRKRPRRRIAGLPPNPRSLTLPQLLRWVRKYDSCFAGYSCRRLVEVALGSNDFPQETHARYELLRRERSNYMHVAMHAFCVARIERAACAFTRSSLNQE